MRQLWVLGTGVEWSVMYTAIFFSVQLWFDRAGGCVVWQDLIKLEFICAKSVNHERNSESDFRATGSPDSTEAIVSR